MSLERGAIRILWAKEKAIKKERQALISQLCQAVPESLAAWFNRTGRRVINDVLINASVERYYYEKDGGYSIDGFDSFADFKQALNELRVAWEGVILVSMPGNLRSSDAIVIRFSAV